MKQTGSEKSGSKTSFGSLAYLLLYNVAQCIGWTAMAFLLALHWFQERTHVGMYSDVEKLLNIFQTAAVLEVVHAATGLVRSNAMLTGFQVMSRVFVTWGITYSFKEVQDLPGVPMFLWAWSLVEIIRYAYYACSIFGTVPHWLTWCRYTFFIILYPLGVTGELLSIYNALPYAKKTGMYSLSMPNAANIAFSYYYALYLAVLAYIPVFPQLYMHMFRQRKKILGGTRLKQE